MSTEANPVQTSVMGRLAERAWPGALTVTGIEGVEDLDVDGLDRYYVPVVQQAPTRCIDGRHDPRLDEAVLGPQVPGGSPGAALAHRLGVHRDDLARGTFLEDAETMLGFHRRLGLLPGGHRDDHEHRDTVGCGAIDAMPAALDCLIDPSLVADHQRLVHAVLGADFDRDHYLRILGAGLVLRGHGEEYFAGRGRILDVLERTVPNSVTVLQGRHREAWVVVNLVAGTTLSSNRFAADHGGLQAFGYDPWWSRYLADRLFPLPSQRLDRERFVHARAMLAVATLMALTDGSLSLVVRRPGSR
jgi:hypothetical protein